MVRVSLLLAWLWGGALLVAGFVLPVYEESTVTSSGTATASERTLVAVNGLGVVLLLAVPLVVSAMVAVALFARDWRPALPVAWAATGLLAVLTGLLLLSIGVYMLPTLAALVVACTATTRARRSVRP